MRAKEYLAHRKEDIYYYAHVKKAIRALYPLREDKTGTEVYFNRHLFADARKRVEEMKDIYRNAREEWQEAVEAIIHCLFEHLNIELTEECLAKKNELWELFKEFYMSYCKPYIIKNQIEELRATLARKEMEIAMWKTTADDLEIQLDRKTSEAGKGGMTVMEIVLTFYYLFNELGLNFSNSDKTQWARFIHKLTGKSYQHIRGMLSLDFDRKSTLKNLRNVAALFKELFPLIEQKIVNDMAPVIPGHR